MLTNQSIGYIDAPIPKGLDLKEEINRMRREKNAVILAHYYQTGDIQDIADFVGDSLALAQQAAKTTADIIVFCGVHFMGETAKVLCPDKKVLVPDLNAGCSLADSCPAVDFAEFVKQHPGHVVISYVNTTAAVKAVTDVVVTSTNARQIVESFPEDTCSNSANTADSCEPIKIEMMAGGASFAPRRWSLDAEAMQALSKSA